MSGEHLHATRGIEQRLLLFGLVLALIVAPVLANVWPAFGKGPMLYVGDAEASHVAVDGHAAHGGHAHPAHESHHQTHCALCVLAFLGWAPPLALELPSIAASAIDRAVTVAAHVPRLRLVWPGARARAPPLS